MIRTVETAHSAIDMVSARRRALQVAFETKGTQRITTTLASIHNAPTRSAIRIHNELLKTMKNWAVVRINAGRKRIEGDGQVESLDFSFQMNSRGETTR